MDDVRSRLRSASQLAVVPDRAFDRLRERRDRERGRQRLASLMVAALIGVGSFAGVALLTTGLREDPGTAVSTGWESSRRLALDPGEYFYLRITSDEAEDGRVRDEETWWAPDGSGEVRNRGTRLDKYPYPPPGGYERGRFPIWLHGVSSLSTDPAVLAEQLREATYDWEMLLLETPYATPELRAAVFEVARGLQGITVLNDTRDPGGRRAIALETSERDGPFAATWRSYFDPGTHQALAWTFESTRGGSAWILLESAIVDAPGEAPESSEWLVPPVGEAPA
jgi:hypothetical protein